MKDTIEDRQPKPNLRNQSYRADDVETQITLLREQYNAMVAHLPENTSPLWDLKESIEACVRKARKREGMSNKYSQLRQQVGG